MKNVFKGFTLAEVLITLAVIGVVAVLSIGIFMPKIQDKVLAMQEKTAKIKFTKAMEQMALNNKIGPLYQDTEEFVSELQNYLKVAKVCKNDKLADCFGYETFIDASGEEFSLEDAKDGKVFTLDTDTVGDNTDFGGDTAGLVTIDGTPMVLAWNKKCETLEPGVYQWGNNTNKSTGCVAALMDVNGTKRPDKLGKDLILLNASNFKNAACIEFTVNGQTYKWGCPFEPTPLNREQCLALVDEGKISACADANASGYIGNTNQEGAFWNELDGDRWAGAVQTCGGTDKMLSPADIAALVEYLYDGNITLTGPAVIGQSFCPGYVNCINTTKLSDLSTTLSDVLTSGKTYSYSGGGGSATTNNRFSLWSSSESSSISSEYMCFSTFYTYYSTAMRYGADIFGVCKL